MSGITDEERDVFASVFQKVDQEHGDGGGHLNEEQLYLLLVMCGFRITREIMQVKFNYTELDGNWRISLEEYLNVLDGIAPTGSFESIAAGLRRKLDASYMSKDGQVSLPELREALGSDFVELPGVTGSSDTDTVDVEVYVRTFAKAKVNVGDGADEVDAEVEEDDDDGDSSNVIPSSDELRWVGPNECTELAEPAQQSDQAESRHGEDVDRQGDHSEGRPCEEAEGRQSEEAESRQSEEAESRQFEDAVGRQDDLTQKQIAEQDAQEQHDEVDTNQENTKHNDEIAEVNDDEPEIQMVSEMDGSVHTSQSKHGSMPKEDENYKLENKRTNVNNIADSWKSRSENVQVSTDRKLRSGSASSPDSECKGISVKALTSRYQKMHSST